MVRGEDATQVKVVTYYRLCDRFSFGALILKDEELKAVFRQEAEAKTAYRVQLGRRSLMMLTAPQMQRMRCRARCWRGMN